ncbi:mucin-2-like [Scylla paramamosain]|uniref:mucin-2-like n=1 Tax=Scylla paramamosain TaxID=85552 RepID=UPI003083AE64
MLTKLLLLLAAVCVPVRSADDVTTPAPAAGVTSDSADDFSVAVLIATPPDEITTTAPPAVTPLEATAIPDSASVAPSYRTDEDTPVIPAVAEARVLTKRSDAQPRLLPPPRHIFGGGGHCSPPTATRYFTITSTHLIPSVTYATAINYIPTTISQELTEWRVKTSTVLVTQTVTTFASPRLITQTQVFTAPKYLTQVQHHTQIKYVTSTDTRTYTDTSVEVATTARTNVVSVTHTTTATHVTTSTQRRVVYTTDTQYTYVTQTKNVSNYVIHTLTSPYRVYRTVTHTRTEDEYVTQTSVYIRTILVTSCRRQPYYTKGGKYSLYG